MHQNLALCSKLQMDVPPILCLSKHLKTIALLCTGLARVGVHGAHDAGKGKVWAIMDYV